MILILGSVILNKVLCASAKILDSIFEGTVDKSTKLNAFQKRRETREYEALKMVSAFMKKMRRRLCAGDLFSSQLAILNVKGSVKNSFPNDSQHSKSISRQNSCSDILDGRKIIK